MGSAAADRAVLPTALVFALVLLGLVCLRGEPLLLALPLVFYLAAGLLHVPAEVRLEAHRVLESDRVGTQTPMEVRLTVRNVGPGLEWVRIADGVPDHTTSVCSAVPPPLGWI